ncbi:hypothetical protein P3L51_10990 [Streptomyces sp. PSRA5]
MSAECARADTRQPSGVGDVARTVRESMDAIRMDFAEANQWVGRRA